MKKVLCLILAVGMLMTLFCVSAAAAGNNAAPGIYGLAVETGYAGKVTLAPKTAAGDSITASSTTIDDKAVSGFYANAEQVEVTITGLTSGAQYLVLVLNDESSRPTESNLAYIDQAGATGASITFAVYPNKLESGKTYRIYLSSNAEKGDLVQIASFRYGTSDTPKEDDGGNTGGGNTGGGGTTGGGGAAGGGAAGGGAAGGGVGGEVTGPGNAKRFVDMPGHWAEASVDFVTARNLFQGTSETTFSPNMTMTRGMLVTVLYRLAGEPEGNMTAAFADVAKGTWYTDAVAWGNATGVVKGYTDTIFGPGDNITREQLAVMIYRYAQTLGYAKSGDEAAKMDFADTERVSGWALTEMSWIVSKGIITGKPGNMLDPQGNASRAEVATVLERFVNFLEAK